MLDLFHHIGDANVVGNITLQEWLNKIQYSPDFSDLIDTTRQDGTGPEGSIRALKNTLPCVAYNFRFNRYKTNKNIISGTGYLYIDVDTPGFDISILDTTKIHAYYRSIRLQGYCIIVRVDELTLENFKATYEFICKDLGLELDYDTCAKKATQFSVISYDKEMFFNPDSYVYPAIENTTAPQSMVIREAKNTYTKDGGAPQYTGLRFDDTDEIYIPEGQDYVVNWDEGFEIMKVWLPRIKLKDGRYRTMLSYASTLVALNMDKLDTEKKLAELLHNINPILCEEPITAQRVNSIVKTVMRYRAEGTLKGIKYKKVRRIIHRKRSKLTKEEKMQVNVEEIAKWKTGCSIKKIKNIIDNWNTAEHGLISQRKMVEFYPISKKTVEKYWKQFKVQIDEYNRQYKLTLTAPQCKAIREGEYIYHGMEGGFSSHERTESKPKTSPTESGITIHNPGSNKEEIERNIKQVIDEFIGAGDFSFDAEIKLMLRMKDTAKEIHALDNSINPGKQYSRIAEYYNKKLKAA